MAKKSLSSSYLPRRHPQSSTMIERNMMTSTMWLLSLVVILQLLVGAAWGRPVVRNIRSTHEFDRLLQKHASETGLPVVVDFYSDSCGPCRMMAPIFKKVAAQYLDQAVFVKIDTQAQYELASRYQVRSLPTFSWFLGGKTVHSVTGGIGEGPLVQETQKWIRQSQAENVQVSLESLTEFYAKMDATKTATDIQAVYKKCVDMNKKNIKGNTLCMGSAANQLVRRLKKKYKSGPATTLRFTPDDQKASSSSAKSSSSDSSSGPKKTRDNTTRGGSSSSSSSSNKANLHLASKEEIMAELERRLDAERDEQVENEDESEEEPDPDFSHAAWSGKSDFPERMIIVGGGPAGMAAAIYGARAGLQPLVIAPSMGGQLQGKGVDVENYPGVVNMTGPALVAWMRRQAAHFGAVFEDDVVIHVDASSSSSSSRDDGPGRRPIQITTNNTGTIETHTLVISTGAESNWLNIVGEYELRGGGVSSCATCDGFLYSNKHVIVVGGGDTAMEDALVLARTSQKVTVIHRRDSFRASKVLADRVLNHPSITVEWNTTVKEILGVEVTDHHSSDEQCDDDDDEEGGASSNTMDLDNLPRVVSGVVLQDTTTGQERRLSCQAVFVAIGHTPTTQFLNNVVQFNPQHPGYIQTFDGSTRTSVPGIFAAGDVVDPVYRQAITSAGSGAAAALDAERYLSEHGLGNEAAEFEAELLAELLNGSGAGADDAESSGGYNAYAEVGGRFHGVKESLAA